MIQPHSLNFSLLISARSMGSANVAEQPVTHKVSDANNSQVFKILFPTHGLVILVLVPELLDYAARKQVNDVPLQACVPRTYDQPPISRLTVGGNFAAPPMVFREISERISHGANCDIYAHVPLIYQALVLIGKCFDGLYMSFPDFYERLLRLDSPHLLGLSRPLL